MRTLKTSAWALALMMCACGSDGSGAASPDEVEIWKKAGQTILNGAGCAAPGPTCPGAQAPDLKLTDFNPTSETFESTVNVAPDGTRPKVVALLAGW